MKNSIFCEINTKENAVFINNLDQITQKISQILPFSKVAVLLFSNEYFSFYQQFKPTLLQNGLNVIDVVMDNNFIAEKDNFNDFLSLPEDVRGVIVFNKRFVPLIFSNYLKDKTTFFIENNQDCFGLAQNYYHVREYYLLKELPRNNQAYIMVNSDKAIITNYIKSACLYVHMLIDYIFRQNLLNEKINAQFVNKVKSLLIDVLFIFKNKQDDNYKKAIEKLILVENCLSKQRAVCSCSAIASCFLSNGSFFNTNYCFSASKVIVDKYRQAFYKNLQLKDVDYSEIAKTLYFITKLNPKQILSSLESQVKKLNLIELSSIKTEIQKLILLYKDLKGLIKEKSKVGDKFFQQTLNLSVNLSGYTPFGVNGMTAILWNNLNNRKRYKKWN